MNRRDFIQIAALGTLGLGVPRSLAALSPPSELQMMARPDLLDLFGEPRVVLELGAAYRRSFPWENNQEALVHAVLPRGDPRHSRTGPDLQMLIRQQIRRDFDRGETVRLNGWILSLTEARQCALFSLLPT